MESLQESKSQDEVMYKKEWLTQKYIKLNSGLVIQWKYEMQEQETFTQVLADQFIEIKQVVQDKSYQFYDYLKNTISQSISGAQNKNPQLDQQKHQEMINQLKIDEEQMESQFNFKDSVIKIQKQGKQQDQKNTQNLDFHPEIQKLMPYPNNLNFSDSESDYEQNNEDEDQEKISKKQKDSEDDIQIYELNCNNTNIQPEKSQKNKQSLKDKIFKQKQYQEDVDEQIKLLQNQDLGLGQEFQSMVRQYEYEFPSVGKLEDIQVNWIQILHQRKKEAYELNLKIFKTYLRIKSSENCVKSIEINQQQQKRQIEYIDQLIQQPESEIKIKQAQKTLRQLQVKETEIQKNTIQDCTQIIQRVNLEKNPIVHSFINYLQIYSQKLPQIKYQKIK
ncbi:hypothetical protein PPERSA_04682 [Pseudocohnilembus persalinus]|uniref:Uncharacterized protein n=1 Tax=Pseudocohnilembus persalinus TaxID=266149 RepID=A0A0V0R4U3_PSEPJ|nr:hypothetical protein PPERSA_04682 [Pseudocohnilembus persalinus]|eukprot:KRX09376.1 hypothetical protein PPERSA_04682 [Pseudocohnilembus persalinus]